MCTVHCLRGTVKGGQELDLLRLDKGTSHHVRASVKRVTVSDNCRESHVSLIAHLEHRNTSTKVRLAVKCVADRYALFFGACFLCVALSFTSYHHTRATFISRSGYKLQCACHHACLCRPWADVEYAVYFFVLVIHIPQPSVAFGKSDGQLLDLSHRLTAAPTQKKGVLIKKIVGRPSGRPLNTSPDAPYPTDPLLHTIQPHNGAQPNSKPTTNPQVEPRACTDDEGRVV